MGRKGIDHVSFEGLSTEIDCCEDRFASEFRVFGHDLIEGFTSGQSFEDMLDGNPCAYDDGFSHHDVRVGFDQFHDEELRGYRWGFQ